MTGIKRIDLGAEQDRGDRRVDAESRSGGGVPPTMAHISYRFKSGGDNHIVVRQWDGVNEGPDVRMAMPPNLQKQFVGAGYTYTSFQTRVNDVEGTEEMIKPPYTLNQLLLGAYVDGTTGVSLTGPDEDLQLMEVVPARNFEEVC